MNPLISQAANACESGDTVVTTCADWLADAHRDFLQQRKTRAITVAPEDGQISNRISGRAWTPANGDFPVYVAPDGAAVELRTSLSRLGAYYASEDAEKIAKGEETLPEGTDLPEPVTARRKTVDMWSNVKLEGLIPGGSQAGIISHFGADYAVSDDLLVGASVEFEDLQTYGDAVSGATTAGTAFLAGPYMAQRLTDNLVFDARLAWGQSDDAVAGDGMAARVRTERSLAKARLEGDFDLAGWQISSSAAFIHAREAPAGGWAEGVSSNTLTLEPEVRRTFKIEDGPAIQPFIVYRNSAAFDAVENLSELDALSFQGTLGGGVNVTMPGEYNVRATTEIERRDADTDPNLTGRVQVTIPLP